MTERENADEVLNRKRFSDLRTALRMGREGAGVCPMHATQTDAAVLQLEATEAILVDVRDLRISVATFRAELSAAMARNNSVAGAEVELEQRVGLLARAAGATSPWMWAALAIISICVTVIRLKG